MRVFANFSAVFIFAAASVFDWSGLITLAIAVSTAVLTYLSVHYSTKFQAKKAAQDASRQALDAINTGFNDLVQRLQHDNEMMREQIGENQKSITSLQQANADYQARLTISDQHINQLSQDLSSARAEIVTLRHTNHDLIVELTKTQAALSLHTQKLG